MNNNSSNNNSNCSNNMNNSNNRNNNNTNKNYKKKKVKILKAMKKKFPSRWNKFQKSSFIPPSVTRTVLGALKNITPSAKFFADAKFTRKRAEFKLDFRNNYMKPLKK